MTPWNDELQDALKAAAADGLSASQIAVRLNRLFRANLTRNAVIGRMHRTHVASRNSPGFNVRVAKQPKRRAARPKPIPIPPPTPRVSVVAEGCRWPLWGHDEAPTHVYCGQTKAFEWRSSYCQHHFMCAHFPPERVSAWLAHSYGDDVRVIGKGADKVLRALERR